MTRAWAWSPRVTLLALIVRIRKAVETAGHAESVIQANLINPYISFSLIEWSFTFGIYVEIK